MVAFVAACAWTLLILVSPSFRFVADWPSARVPIETTGALIAVLVATLAYFRYAYTGVRALLLVAVAFLVLGTNEFIFGVVVRSDVIERHFDVYAWTWTRSVAGALLLGGTLARFSHPSARRHPFVDLLVGIVGGVLVAGAGSFVLLAALDGRSWSPETAEAIRRVALSGGVPPVGSAEIVLGLVGAALFLIAAARYAVRGRDREPAPALLALALVVAAFAHLHNTLVPTVFSDAISTGDVLRFASQVIVLGGLMWEVRQAYLAERDRAELLASAYARERLRAEELERVDRARADLVRLVTHELMHPVAAVRGWVLTLQRRWDELDDRRKIEIVARLGSETERLRDLAEQVPDATHVGGLFGSVFTRRERVWDLIDESTMGIEGLDGRLKVDVDATAGDAEVRADGTRVVQVLRNLLQNAARYGDEAPVTLSVRAHDREAVFEVMDTGPGIARDDLPKVFWRGYRAKNASEPGAGLGLFIVKSIVDAHGGTISAESEPGVRTSLRFSLPLWDKP